MVTPAQQPRAQRHGDISRATALFRAKTERLLERVNRDVSKLDGNLVRLKSDLSTFDRHTAAKIDRAIMRLLAD